MCLKIAVCVLFVFENDKNAEYFVKKMGNGNYEKSCIFWPKAVMLVHISICSLKSTFVSYEVPEQRYFVVPTRVTQPTYRIHPQSTHGYLYCI